MINYETGTALHFILFAVLFTAAFAFATWRIVRNLENENDTVISDDEVNADDSQQEPEKPSQDTDSQ